MTVDSLDALAGFVRAAPLGVVATVAPDGSPEAALVGLAVTPSGDLLFTTATAARKVHNLGVRSRVAVVLGCTGTVSVQVEGDAVVESGEARLVAARTYIEWFPGSRALHDGFSVVRVRPDWLRHYDVDADPMVVFEGRPVWNP